MINENKLTKHYSEIAQKLDEIIPVKWNEIIMYAEEVGDVSSVSFYFYIDNCETIHYSGDIPDEFNISRNIFNSLLRELRQFNKNLWLEFKNAEESTWSSLTFYLDSNWKFKVKFGYERNAEIGHLEREIRWAYDELGIIPENDYEKKLLEEYLKEQGKSL